MRSSRRGSTLTRRRALIIATESYESEEFSRLPGTAVDAEGLERVLGDPRIGDFDVTVLQDANLRDAGVAIDRFFKQAGVDDMLLLHISGHGARDSHGDLYFVNHDTEPSSLRMTALAANDVSREIHESRARRIVVLLDCCYAGAFVRNDGLHGEPPPDAAAAMPGAPHEPGAVSPPDDARYGGVAPADIDDELRSRGQVTIAAATSIEHAYEAEGKDEEIRSGLFTRCIVHGLATGAADLNRDGEVDANELYQYVRVRMRKLGGGRRQNPTYSAQNVQGVLRIAHSPRGPLPPPPVDLLPPTEDPIQRPAGSGTWPDTAARESGDLEPGRAPRYRVPRYRLPRYRVPRYRELGGRGPLPRRILVPLLAVAGLLCGCGTQADSRVAGGECPTPTQIRVAAAPTRLTAYRDLAAEFERWVAGEQHGCRSVDLYVYPVASDELAEGLRRGWGRGPDGKDYLRDVGPHPDVWLPAAATEVPPDDTPVKDIIDRVEPVARTPIVLGVPQRTRLDDDEDDRRELSWPELFATVSERAGVVRADFATSAVARMATARLYRDGTIDPAAARTDVEQRLERALDAGRYPVGDEADLLCRQRAAAGRTAVIVTEQELVRFNRGDPADGPCLVAARPAPGDRLSAFYPAQTPVVDQVAVTLIWPRQAQTRGASAYARWFVRWLRQKPGRAALLRSGWRPFAYDAAEPLGPEYGALTDWPFGKAIKGEPDALTRREVAELYAEARRPGRFMVALDASGSMNTVTADPTRTRFEVAVAAVEQAVTRLGPRDELGLLTFAAEGGRSTREVLPIARAGADAVGRVRRATAPIKPAGDTPLYEAVRRGAGALRAGSGAGDPLRTLVVLTDGKDTSGQPRPSAAQTAGVRIFVIAVGDLSCADAALKRLTTDSAGRCFDAGQDSLEPVLTGMFRAIWDTKGN